ncbi:hypothetical protein CO059_00220 [candidate division WWE3 bacterium CG_4_9_14_0_2_um_filter_48_10]|uniref:Uncharacterized protein n=1 Tax=candidate division WWE3 bacterium CG_4_9_14_0_2_um_filter_48_10 TaxID=1975078 RepID=A0A2M8EKE3_UNCKA|nr:MAG: hypothetical protein CO059_00220 [candidate division WWE3 bacterium CG_4_9_14_0_2_um_filter_48_10]
MSKAPNESKKGTKFASHFIIRFGLVFVHRKSLKRCLHSFFMLRKACYKFLRKYWCNLCSFWPRNQQKVPKLL